MFLLLCKAFLLVELYYLCRLFSTFDRDLKLSPRRIYHQKRGHAQTYSSNSLFLREKRQDFASLVRFHGTPNNMVRIKHESASEHSPDAEDSHGVRRRVVKACQRCRLKKCKVRNHPRMFASRPYQSWRWFSNCVPLVRRLNSVHALQIRRCNMHLWQA